MDNCNGLIEGNSTLIIFIKFEYNVGADDEVMDVVEEGCCENNDVGSVEKCDVFVEGKKSLIINII